MEKQTVIENIAFILDGNGRWAKKRNLPRAKGHYEGGKRVSDIAVACSKRGIKKMFVYAFSTENWKRSEEEVTYIFKLPKIFLKLYLKEMMKNNIRIEYIGDLDKIPSYAKKAIKDSVQLTKNNTGMELIFALNYGFKNEMEYCVKNIVSKVIDNELSIDDINSDVINDNLMDGTSIDLVIRTSGEQRLSNFMLWQVAYSELYFSEVLWPDFDEKQLDIVLENYGTRERRFGGRNDEE